MNVKVKMELLKMLNKGAFVMPGMDAAIIGWAYSKSGIPVALYSADKMVAIYMKRDKMTREEAWEFLEYNPVRGCQHYGNDAPIIMGGRF